LQARSAALALTQSALFDPQTAGGLLISLPKERSAEYIELVSDAIIIGKVNSKEDHLIEVG
jgi:selenophosphate synthase